MDSGKKYELLHCLHDKILGFTQEVGGRTHLFPNGIGVTVGEARWRNPMDIKKISATCKWSLRKIT